ncbi:MAG: BON domain-containing protein [Deltaproteobacteria bacterium]|nr:BON domain-containing protein [Deltaproteobacteria bacterium]
MIKAHRFLSYLVCVLMMAVFVGCASTDKQESTGQFFDDSVITTKVKAAVFNEPSLKVLQINVETYKGEVQLSGFVDSADSARKAGEVAAKISGVKSVRNNLVVR